MANQRKKHNVEKYI